MATRVDNRNAAKLLLDLHFNDPTLTNVELHLRSISRRNALAVVRALRRNKCVARVRIIGWNSDRPNFRKGLVRLLRVNRCIEHIELAIPKSGRLWKLFVDELIQGGGQVRLKCLSLTSAGLDSELLVLAKLLNSHPNFAVDLHLTCRYREPPVLSVVKNKIFFQSLFSSNIECFNCDAAWIDLRALVLHLQDPGCRLRGLGLILQPGVFPLINRGGGGGGGGGGGFTRFLSCLLNPNSPLKHLYLCRGRNWWMEDSRDIERGVRPDWLSSTWSPSSSRNGGGCNGKSERGTAASRSRLNTARSLEIIGFGATEVEDIFLELSRMEKEQNGKEQNVTHLRLVWDMGMDSWKLAADPLSALHAITTRIFRREAFRGVRHLHCDTTFLHEFPSTAPPMGAHDVVTDSICAALFDNSSIQSLSLGTTVPAPRFRLGLGGGPSRESIRQVIESLLPRLPNLASLTLAWDLLVRRRRHLQSMIKAMGETHLRSIIQAVKASRKLHCVRLVLRDVIDHRSAEDVIERCSNFLLDRVEELRFECEKNRIGFPGLLLSSSDQVQSSSTRTTETTTTTTATTATTAPPPPDPPLALWPSILSKVQRADVLHLLVLATHDKWIISSLLDGSGSGR